MRIHCLRLQRGTDILSAIQAYCSEQQIRAGVVLSAVGCVSRAVVRDAGGVKSHTLTEPLELVSLFGTIGAERCHLHLSLAREDLSVLGGHLLMGCLVNTTCELVLGEIENVRFSAVFDPATGYDELSVDSLQKT